MNDDVNLHCNIEFDYEFQPSPKNPDCNFIEFKNSQEHESK
jgi:hypothetical protein